MSNLCRGPGTSYATRLRPSFPSMAPIRSASPFKVRSARRAVGCHIDRLLPFPPPQRFDVSKDRFVTNLNHPPLPECSPMTTRVKERRLEDVEDVVLTILLHGIRAECGGRGRWFFHDRIGGLPAPWPSRFFDHEFHLSLRFVDVASE